MKAIVITGWNEGFQKVRFTQFLQRQFGYSLYDAKKLKDGVMDDVAVELTYTGDDVEAVLRAMRELGARVEIAVPAGR